MPISLWSLGLPETTPSFFACIIRKLFSLNIRNVEDLLRHASRRIRVMNSKERLARAEAALRNAEAGMHFQPGTNWRDEYDAAHQKWVAARLAAIDAKVPDLNPIHVHVLVKACGHT
jgi:hypothetical protein